MQRVLSKPLIAVVGPTATGKTALAQRLATYCGASVLSADSMQVYRGMDIGTGKIPSEQRTVGYYGLDLVDPGEPYSAALFQSYGRAVVDRCDDDGLRCIVCGGTGFYVRAVVDAFEFPPGDQVCNPVRLHYERMLEECGPESVWNELLRLDPASAAVVSPNDSKRVIRALELYDQGMSYALQKADFSRIPQYYTPLCLVGLTVDPGVLVGQIDNRVDAMVEMGLVDEVQGLLDKGYREAVTANQAIGYKEFVSYLDGLCSLDEAIERVKVATRRYAKRQRTWFSKDKRITWIDATHRTLQAVFDEAAEVVFPAIGSSSS